MRRNIISAWILFSGCVVLGSGCHYCQPGCPGDENRCGLFGGHGLGLFRAKPVAPAPPPNYGIQAVPQPGLPNPVPPALPNPVPPAVAPADLRSYPPPAPDLTWKPSTDKNLPQDGTRLLPPEQGSAPAPQIPKPGVSENRNQPSSDAGERTRVPSLPVGIPQFAPVKDKVASGLKPNLDGGLDWLQINGHKTVLHLRQPGEDNAADRREVEKRGLKYLTLEVSPETLSLAIVDNFAKLVNDPENLPLFVYDKDGMLAGGLWYLFFRTQDKAADQTARIAAGRLGLKEGPEGDHKAMWLAIQKVLASQP